jgi:response regulator RpfG family c-di-GMP phosphodiesterase
VAGGGSAVLIASADWRLRRVIRAAIRSDRYDLIEAGSFDDAWGILWERHPTVAVVDVRLGDRDGVELCRAVHSEPGLATSRAILIGDAAEPELAAPAALEADAFLLRPFSPRELVRHVDRLLASSARPAVRVQAIDADEARRARANVRLAYAFRVSETGVTTNGSHDPTTMAHAVDDAQQLRMVEDFRDAYHESVALAGQLELAYQQTIVALAKAVEARDLYTGGHVERVRKYSVDIGRRMGIADDELRQIEMGAVLHDVGKIGVPDSVLTKPGPLAPEEWQVMRRHPEIGRGMLAGIGFLTPSLDAVAHHHERWDGGGYPGGLSKQEIPVAGRIVAVADAFDAMTTTRVYRRGLGPEQALEEIGNSRRKCFDPEVVEAFLDVAPRAA